MPKSLEPTKDQVQDQPISVIGLVGRAGSGKSTAADILSDLGWIQLGFADPIKDMACLMLGVNREQLELAKASNIAIPLSSDSAAPLVSVRSLLQKMGTEFGREMIHPQLWLWLLHAKLQHVAASGGGSHRVVVTDVRFANEADFLKKVAGAVLVGIRSDQLWATQTRLDLATSNHASEAEIDTLIQSSCDYVVINNSTLADFVISVTELAACISPLLGATR